jgi:PAS domain S-box-containing protein
MSALIRNFDWASTPLGPLDTWPSSILTTVGIVLRSPVPIVTLWGEQGTMIYNDAYSGFAGGRHPSLLGSAVREGWPEVADFNDNVMKVGLGGGVLSYRDHELVLRRRGGHPEHVFMDLDYSPVIGEAGVPVGVIAIVVETTERVQADRKVRESEDRFRNIADAAPVMMWISDSAHGCTWFNRPWLDFTGRPLTAELGKGWLDNLHSDDRVRALAQYDRSFAARTPFRMDIRLRRADGAWRTLEETGVPQFGADGAFINFIGCCSDVTEQRAAEASLRESEARLRFLDLLARETARSADADSVLAATTRMLGEHLGVAICAYADMETDGDHFTIRGDWSAPGSPSIVGRYSLADFGRRAVENLSRGEPLIIHDNRAELPPEEAATFQAIGIGATICMPLVKDGRLTALMAIHDKGPHRWSGEELSLLREVTERSWAHIERVSLAQASRESAERLRLATAAASIGTWDFAPREGLLRWDDRCKQLFGLSPDVEVSYADSFLAGLHPDDRQRTQEAVQRALDPADAKPFDIEYRTVGIEDGQLRWVAATGNAVFDAGEAVRFVGTVRDITARKRAEIHLRILNDTGASVAAERDLGTIVQTVTDAGVELTGAQFGAFFYNVLDEKGGRYMLYSLSGAPREAFASHPMPRATAVFEPTFLGHGVVRSDDIKADPRYGRSAPHHGMPTGHLPVRSYLAVPVVSRTGEVLGGLFFGHGETGRFTEEHETALLGIAGHAATAIDNANLLAAAGREVAERRRAEEALQTLNATLEERVRAAIAERTKAGEALAQSQKMEAVGQLTGGIAHDFNNLLTAVLGSLELLRRRMPDDPALLRLVDNAVEGAQRGGALTQRMLAFARRQDLKMQDVDPLRLVVGMTDLLQRSLGPMIAVTTSFPPRLPAVATDPNQLEAALLNLAVNARDAMQGAGRIAIAGREETVSAGSGPLAPGRYVCISVTDNGEGMDEATLKRATEPFFTTKGVGKGTGLGLSMVQGLAEQSGGMLRLHSKPGAGTTVEIWLPAVTSATRPAPATVTQPVEQAVAHQSRLRVLCVDDDALVLMNTVAMLEDMGHEVVEANSGIEALDAFEPGRFDLVITDHAMPKMTGSQLALELRRREPSLPILLATGYAERTPGVADDLPRLSKPFWQADLAAAMRNALGASKN